MPELNGRMVDRLVSSVTEGCVGSFHPKLCLAPSAELIAIRLGFAKAIECQPRHYHHRFSLSLNILEHFSISIPTTNLNSGIVPVKLSEIFIQRFLTKISRKQCNMLRPTIPLELLSFDKSY